MKRSMGMAAATAAILVWGLPLVDAQPVELSLDDSADLGSAMLLPDDGNITRAVARLAWNASAETRSSGSAGAGSDPGEDQTPVAALSAGQSSSVGPLTEDASKGALVAAGAGTLVGLGMLAYYWAGIKVWMLGTVLAPFFSRIAKEKILDNEVRNRVFDAIEHNPGVTIKEITDICSIGWGTAVYHLKRLEDETLVVSERHRQYRRYFKNGGGIVNGQKKAYSELKSATGQALAMAVVQNPGSVQKDLCRQVGISAPLAHKYLSRLEKAELVRKEKEWKFVRYFPTDRLGSMVQTPLLASP